MRSFTLALVVMLTLTGCSWMPFFGDEDEDKESETAGYTETDFYNVIQRNLNARNWRVAIENLQALEAQFPFGTYAEQAQLELMYAHYRSADYEAAIAAADRFIRLHPRHANVDYAYYIKGLSSLAQSRGFFGNFLPTDNTSRDPGAARESFATFAELLTRFPESPYAADTRKRMIFLRNVLSRYEIHVANYYFERGAYLAAANRGRYVVENFQQTPAVPDGLAVMAEAYHLLGLHDLSADAVKVLAANYPEYPAFAEDGSFQYQGISPDDSKPWIRRLTLGLYDNSKPPRFDTRHLYNPTALADQEEMIPNEGEEKSWWRWFTFGLVK
ncbi:MAG: outer membrane protein assembly factor BamD [Porticoccaceae bacterium]|nr:outer membrane protein assembly factor BamD [Porticoccaceae bacterium]HLS98789.1 outer membrane protein assembly factor BamD [Porticoccaceae bacterium]